MNKWIRWFSLIFALVVVLAYNACTPAISIPTDNGTATVGNGMTPKNAAQQIAQSLCQVISTCAPGSSPVTIANCYTNIQPVTNIVPLLGASSTTYPTFGSLINANLNGTILGNTVATTSSVNQILSQSCSSSAVQGIYTSGGPNYSNAGAIVPASSTTIFTPPTAIYRSVGPGNNTALASGSSNALTISGTTATFASALPNNVGVGDAVVYASNNQIAFISGRISSTTYTLQTAAGGTPISANGDTSWSIFRAYTSIQNALTGSAHENTGIPAGIRNFDSFSSNNNLGTANTKWNLALYGDATDTYNAVPIQLGGWTTSATNTLRIYAPFLSTDVGVSQRHNGAWTASGVATIAFPAAYEVHIDMSNVIIDGLQFSSTNMSSECTLTDFSSQSNITITNNILNGTATSNGTSSGMCFSQSSNVIIANNIIFGFSGRGVAMQCNSRVTGCIFLYNNTIVNSATYGIQTYSNAGTVKNNIVIGSGTSNYSPSNPAYYAAPSNYNLSSDGTSTGGANDLTNKTVIFVNSATNDFLLSVSDTSAKGAGENLSSDSNYSFTTDITNIIRTVPWDIGASTPH